MVFIHPLDNATLTLHVRVLVEFDLNRIPTTIINTHCAVLPDNRIYNGLLFRGFGFTVTESRQPKSTMVVFSGSGLCSPPILLRHKLESIKIHIVCLLLYVVSALK